MATEEEYKEDYAESKPGMNRRIQYAKDRWGYGEDMNPGVPLGPKRFINRNMDRVEDRNERIYGRAEEVEKQTEDTNPLISQAAGTRKDNVAKRAEYFSTPWEPGKVRDQIKEGDFQMAPQTVGSTVGKVVGAAIARPVVFNVIDYLNNNGYTKLIGALRNRQAGQQTANMMKRRIA